MSPARAREILRAAGGFAPLPFLTPQELDWVATQIPASAPIDTTAADLIRAIASQEER